MKYIRAESLGIQKRGLDMDTEMRDEWGIAYLMQKDSHIDIGRSQ